MSFTAREGKRKAKIQPSVILIYYYMSLYGFYEYISYIIYTFTGDLSSSFSKNILIRK